MNKARILLVCMLALAFAGPAMAKKTFFDADVTGDVIFGCGNDNGAFTVVQNKGVEVALRAKQRFPTPAHVFNSNGDGTYTFPAGDACPGYSWNGFPLCLTTPVWSFEWAVNTDYDGSTGMVLSDFVYILKMDSDPGKNKKFTEFDPITPSLVAPLFDHGIGDNSTLDCFGMKAVDPFDYLNLLDNYNIAQNSWNYEFFNNLGTSLASFDPAVPGVYDIALEVRDSEKGKKYAEVAIQVIVEAP